MLPFGIILGVCVDVLHNSGLDSIREVFSLRAAESVFIAAAMKEKEKHGRSGMIAVFDVCDMMTRTTNCCYIHHYTRLTPLCGEPSSNHTPTGLF